MFTATKSKLPVYYENCNGSLADKNNLEYVSKIARSVSIENIIIVMNGDFLMRHESNI